MVRGGQHFVDHSVVDGALLWDRKGISNCVDIIMIFRELANTQQQPMILNLSQRNMLSFFKFITLSVSGYKELSTWDTTQPPHFPWDRRRPEHVGAAHKLHHQTGLHVPRDMAVEGPQAGIVGDEADQRPRVRVQGEGVADERAGVAGRVRRVNVVVVVGPVEGSNASLQDPLCCVVVQSV